MLSSLPILLSPLRRAFSRCHPRNLLPQQRGPTVACDPLPVHDHPAGGEIGGAPDRTLRRASVGDHSDRRGLAHARRIGGVNDHSEMMQPSHHRENDPSETREAGRRAASARFVTTEPNHSAANARFETTGTNHLAESGHSAKIRASRLGDMRSAPFESNQRKSGAPSPPLSTQLTVRVLPFHRADATSAGTECVGARVLEFQFGGEPIWISVPRRGRRRGPPRGSCVAAKTRATSLRSAWRGTLQLQQLRKHLVKIL